MKTFHWLGLYGIHVRCFLVAEFKYYFGGRIKYIDIAETLFFYLIF